MRARWLVLFVLFATVLASVGVRGQAHAATPLNPVFNPVDSCYWETFPNQETYRICPPGLTSAGLVIWAHGYIAPQDPIAVQDTLPDGSDLANLVRGMGYTFASTSYRSNGMVALDAQQDIVNLLAYTQALYAFIGQPFPEQVYLIGASMGGLVVTRLAETNPNGAFDGALAACGIVGDFKREINYWGDFNVLHNYFFPGVLPSPSVPLGLENASSDYWKNYPSPLTSLETRVLAALQTPTGPASARQLIATSKAAIDPTNVTASTVTTISQLAYFSRISAADLQAPNRLGGNPFDNRTRWYWGSSNDIRLNLKAERLPQRGVPLPDVSAYQTTGKPKIPLVMPHTLLDPVVPVDQTLLYLLKARASGNSSKVVPLLVPSYGHCNFTAEQLAFSFGLLVYKATGQWPTLPPSLAAEQATSLDFALSEEEVQATLDAFVQAEAAPAPDGKTSVYLPLVIQR